MKVHATKFGRPNLLALLALSLIVVALAACGGNGGAQEDVPAAGVAGEASSATPTTDTAGGSSEARSTAATPAAELPSSSRVSLDEYITTVCSAAQTEVSSWEEGDSLRDLSTGLGFVGEQMSALQPPAEVAEWHNAQIAFAGVFKKTIDDYLDDPGGLTEDAFLLSMFLTVAPHFEPVDAAIAGMDPDLRERMTEAGCIDEETTTTSTSVEAEEISTGGSVKGTFGEPNEFDYLVFQAETGQKYVIEVTWDELPLVTVRVVDLLDPMAISIGGVSQSSPLVHRWTAPKSGTFHIAMSTGEATGSYTVSLSIDGSPGGAGDRPAPPPPTNQRSTPLGEGWQVRITWDAVDGADFYRVYYNTQRSCSAGGSGSSSCEELTWSAGETRTDYIHALGGAVFDPLKDYYWVVACHGDGDGEECSEIDSENPATPAE